MNRSALISDFEPAKDNLLNILHRLQNNNPANYLTRDDLTFVAEYLNITYSSVYGVAKYYSMFSLKPRGKYVVRVCKSPICNMMGGKNMIEEIEKQLEIKLGATTGDQLFSLEPSECLGHCDQAPVMMINEEMHTNLDAEKISEIFHEIKNNNLNK
ncbi:MAG: NAD(P)H-dependent oxidoreductase subunit E [Bacteroidales bacterium]|jgi:NADH-quinone oxidoreductase subunit E|nr:NAD(P)H-dependent oxidoreductase subunit E [Bacteroidales bacterium]